MSVKNKPFVPPKPTLPKAVDPPVQSSDNNNKIGTVAILANLLKGLIPMGTPDEQQKKRNRAAKERAGLLQDDKDSPKDSPKETVANVVASSPRDIPPPPGAIPSPPPLPFNGFKSNVSHSNTNDLEARLKEAKQAEIDKRSKNKSTKPKQNPVQNDMLAELKERLKGSKLTSKYKHVESFTQNVQLQSADSAKNVAAKMTPLTKSLESSEKSR